MKTDAIVRAFREQPELFSGLQAVVAEQKDKILARVASATTSDDLFRLQGELRSLTNFVSHFKTLLGNHDARTSKAA
jgi:hypothetical protein